MKDSVLDDIFMDRFPRLDLHGETRESSRVLIKEFIDDNYLLKNYKLVIIHGIGTGALKKEVLDVLKNNKLVDTFYISRYNMGCTIVNLCSNKKKM